MDTIPLNILLADDDEDDCLFFKQALAELPVDSTLTTVYDGEELMRFLTKKSASLPQVLFLDLNMPRKNGLECLSEIKQDKNLRQLPVIILSTSFDQEMANLLYTNGVHYCIQKPSGFDKLRQVIEQVLDLVANTDFARPIQKNFFLEGKSKTRIP
ncbi:MAG: response regulator [Rudanella sp.]|nr:response regulator [Rudanella sp.]